MHNIEDKMDTNIAETISSSARWLIKQQHKDSGGWPDRSGGHINILNTAEAIIALIDSQECSAGHDSIILGREYIKSHQIIKDDQAYFPREVVKDDGNTVLVPDMVRTCFAVQALLAAGISANDSVISKAVKWLIKNQDKESCGWSYFVGKSVEILPTCFALLTLINVYKNSNELDTNVITRSIDHLINSHFNVEGNCSRGSFGVDANLLASNTLYCILTLQSSRLCNVGSYSTQEDAAIAWLLRNPDRALRQMEAWVDIDGGGYGYTIMADTLLIRALMGSNKEANLKTILFKEAMKSLKDKVDDISGAFYGYRAFSWSTAKAISALSMLRTPGGWSETEFPSRSPEYEGKKTGPTIIWFAVGLAALGTGLMAFEKFNIIGFIFYIALFLGVMTAHNKLSEKTFKEVLLAAINTVKKEK